MTPRSRRIHDRIWDLSARVAVSKDPAELERILPELRSAIHQAIERLRIRSLAILRGRPDVPIERRKILWRWPRWGRRTARYLLV